jgi:putative intracellular protease/amidase
VRKEDEVQFKKQVLLIILEEFADYEYSFLACALQGNIQDKTSPYEVKTVSDTKTPIKSIGGFTILPDYSVDDCPKDYAALILIGGYSWKTEKAKAVIPLLKQAYSKRVVIAAICDATVFLGINGMLNDKKHTSNALNDLKTWASDNYTGQHHYINEPVVRDGNLITANGTATLEFTREVLSALEAYPPKYSNNNYDFFKLGLIEFVKNLK